MTLQDYATLKTCRLLYNDPEINELPSQVGQAELAERSTISLDNGQRHGCPGVVYRINNLLKLKSAYEALPKKWEEVIKRKIIKLLIPHVHHKRLLIVTSRVCLMIRLFYVMGRKFARICGEQWQKELHKYYSQSKNRKVAERYVRDTRIEPLMRFERACQHGLAEDVIMLWNQIDKTVVRNGDRSWKLAFWVKLCVMADKLKNRYHFSCSSETLTFVLDCVRRIPALNPVLQMLSSK